MTLNFKKKSERYSIKKWREGGVFENISVGGLENQILQKHLSVINQSRGL